MTHVNTIIVSGNLTRDPELRYTAQGTAVCHVALATNHRYRQGEELRDEVCYLDVVCFGRQAEAVAAHTATGRPVLVEGRLALRQWTTDDGQPRRKHEVVAQAIHFLGWSATGPQGASTSVDDPMALPE